MVEKPETSQGDSQTTVFDLFLLAVENIKLLIAIPISAGVIALGITFLYPPIYTATGRILPPQPQNTGATLMATPLTALPSGFGAALGIKNPVDLYVGMLRSRTVADNISTRFKLRELYGKKYDEETRKDLAKRTVVSSGKDGLITIEVDDEDPKRAAAMANAYVDALRELMQTLAITEAAQRRIFFEKQLKQTKDDLTRSEIALRSSGISEAALKTAPQSTLEALARLKAQVTAQEVKLGAMRGFMTEANPDYKSAQQELAALRAELAKAEQVDGTKARTSGAEYVTKFREFKYYETLFELMAKQYEVARLDEARDAAVIQVIDVAIPPERKSKPRRAMIAFVTGTVALILAVAVVLGREMFGRATRNPAVAHRLSLLRRSLAMRRA